jgi:hypothetical protein
MAHTHRQRPDQTAASYSAVLPGSGSADRHEGDSRLKAGLNLLLDGYLYARELGRDRWEFAVEIAFLHAAGLNNNDLRWLVGKGFVKHALEVTAKDKVPRISHRVGRLALPSGSCFVLTDTGVEFARQILAAPEPVPSKSRPQSRLKDGSKTREDQPHWDSVTHTLFWRGRLVKHFKHEAPYQEAILEAFQSCNWSRYVVVMLPREEGVNSKERLREAVKNLNRSCCKGLHFTQEGNGGRVGWQAQD